MARGVPITYCIDFYSPSDMELNTYVLEEAEQAIAKAKEEIAKLPKKEADSGEQEINVVQLSGDINSGDQSGEVEKTTTSNVTEVPMTPTQLILICVVCAVIASATTVVIIVLVNKKKNK